MIFIVNGLFVASGWHKIFSLSIGRHCKKKLKNISTVNTKLNADKIMETTINN